MTEPKVTPKVVIDWEEMARLRGLEIDRLHKENQRYREALEFYGKRENYWQPVNAFNDVGYDESVIQEDEGAAARKALKEV